MPRWTTVTCARLTSRLSRRAFGKAKPLVRWPHIHGSMEKPTPPLPFSSRCGAKPPALIDSTLRVLVLFAVFEVLAYGRKLDGQGCHDDCPTHTLDCCCFHGYHTIRSLNTASCM